MQYAKYQDVLLHLVFLAILAQSFAQQKMCHIDSAAKTAQKPITDEVACPDCMHTACNSRYFVSAAAVCNMNVKLEDMTAPPK